MVGLSKDRFTNLTPNLISELTCDICHEILLNPVMIPCCRTLYCKQCLIDWRDFNRACVERKHRLSPHLPPIKAPEIVVNMLSELQLHCDYWRHGCQQLLSFKNLKSHSQNCYFNPKQKLHSNNERSDEDMEVEVEKRKTWSLSDLWIFA